MIYVDAIWALYLVYGGVLSVGYNMGFRHSLSTLINNWFIKKRARAMSIYALATGIGGAIIVPLLSKIHTTLWVEKYCYIQRVNFLDHWVSLSTCLQELP